MMADISLLLANYLPISTVWTPVESGLPESSASRSEWAPLPPPSPTLSGGGGTLQVSTMPFILTSSELLLGAVRFRKACPPGLPGVLANLLPP